MSMRRSRLKEMQSEGAVSPELRDLAQQYRMTRNARTRQTIGRALQGAVMGAAGMAPPTYEEPDRSQQVADLTAALADYRQSRARTEAERMAGLGKIASAREESDTALLKAIEGIMSAAAGPAGSVAAAQVRAIQQQASDIGDAISRTRLAPGERARILRATEGVDPNDVAGVGQTVSALVAGMPDKADQVVAEFFSPQGVGRVLGKRNPTDFMLEVEAAAADPRVVDAFTQAANVNSGGAYAEGVRAAQRLAEQARSIGVPGMRQAAEQLLSVARGVGALPSAEGRAEDRVTEAILNPEALPPDPVEQRLMAQLDALEDDNAPESVAEFRTKLMATPAFNQFVLENGYQDSPAGRKQAFKDVLALERMGRKESRTQQYKGYDQRADERTLNVDLTRLPDGAPPRQGPPPVSGAAEVVAGSSSSGVAAPAAQQGPEVTRQEQPRPSVLTGAREAMGAIGEASARALRGAAARPAIVPPGELLAAQEESLASVRAGQTQKNDAPKRLASPNADMQAPRVDSAIDAYQIERFGRPIGEGELLRMRSAADSVQDPTVPQRVREILKGDNAGPKPPPESEQEPLDPYAESQARLSPRQRDRLAALLRRREVA